MSNISDKELRAGNFEYNNGVLIRTINLLHIKYNKLAGIQRALQDNGMSEGEFLDSVNFLTEAGYIHIRHISDKTNAVLADSEYITLEAKLTEKGIRLARGSIKDNLIGKI